MCLPGGNELGRVHSHTPGDNAHSVKMYKESRTLVVYQFKCQEVAGQLFWMPIKAC